uniref:Cyclic nucleotide-binding domain-containing protein n=1 Tax=Noctiluca scintillans TaxID=2966 RepID=A0A7S1ALZ1_NOCSC
MDSHASRSDGERSPFTARTSGSPRPDRVSGEATVVALTLPVSWPRVILMRAELTRTETLGMLENINSGMNLINLNNMDHTPSAPRGLKAFTAGPTVKARPHLINPDSLSRNVFDFCALFFVIVEITVLPVSMAWDLTYDNLGVSAVFIATFWTTDLVLGFFTAFDVDGERERSLRRIAKHRLKTWFVPDVILVLTDWVAAGLVLADHNVHLIDILRLLRGIRIVRLGRAIRIFWKLEGFMNHVFSDGIMAILKIVSVLLTFMWLNHFICCLWFWIGSSGPSDTGGRWLDMTPAGSEDGTSYFDKGLIYQYIISFHWALGQVTLVGVEGIDATNTGERFYSITLLVLGLLFSSTLISGISAALIDFSMRTSENRNKMRLLRLYLHQNSLDSSLAIKVTTQAEKRLKATNVLRDSDVPALALLSTQLRTELRYSLMSPHTNTHPLFQLWADLSIQTARMIATEAASFVFHEQLDDVFTAGTGGDMAYHVVSGRMRYMQYPESAPVENVLRKDLADKAWVSEASLWAKWIHVGTLEAQTRCQLVAIHALDVVRVVRAHHLITDITYSYALHFHRSIVTAVEPNWPSDLEVPFTDFGEIVVSMEPEMQVTIGLNSLQRGSLPAAQKMMLGKEVETGQAIILRNAQGELERTVSLVAIRVARPDGCILIQLGKTDELFDRVESGCIFPGSKQMPGECPVDAAHRVLASKVAVPNVQLTGAEREVVSKPSAKYAIMTKYFKTIFIGEFDGVMDVVNPCSGDSDISVDLDTGSARAARKAIVIHDSETLSQRDVDVDDNPSSDEDPVLQHHTSCRIRSRLQSGLPPLPSGYNLPVNDLLGTVDAQRTVTLFAWLPEEDYNIMKDQEEHLLKSWIEDLPGGIITKLLQSVA